MEIPGLWTYRIFDPTYVTGNQTPQKELELILADGFVFNFQTPTSTTLEGTFWLPDGGFLLDLKGTVQPGVGGEPVSFNIVGTGRPGTDTAGWEYRYHGHLTRNWPNTNPESQRPFLVGSVIHAKPHNGVSRPAGSVYSFIAVKQQPPFTWSYPVHGPIEAFTTTLRTFIQRLRERHTNLFWRRASSSWKVQPARHCKGRVSGYPGSSTSKGGSTRPMQVSRSWAPGVRAPVLRQGIPLPRASDAGLAGRGR